MDEDFSDKYIIDGHSIVNLYTNETIQFDEYAFVEHQYPYQGTWPLVIILKKNEKYAFLDPEKSIFTGYIFDEIKRIYCDLDQYIKVGINSKYCIWDCFKFDYAVQHFFFELDVLSYNEKTSFLGKNPTPAIAVNNDECELGDYHLYLSPDNLLGPFSSKEHAEEVWQSAIREELIIVFDTETNGLPKDFSNFNNWPELVQISWHVYRKTKYGDLVKKCNYIIYPDNFIISEASSKIHGITTEFAMANGVPLGKALMQFMEDISYSAIIVGHNLDFDLKTIQASLKKAYPKTYDLDIEQLEKRRHICTMKLGTNYCKIPSPKGYKWPTLSELHSTLFSKSFEGAHNAETDVKITSKCFWRFHEEEMIEKLAR